MIEWESITFPPGFAEIMRSQGFNSSVGLSSIKDPAAALEMCRSSAVESPGQPHKDLFIKCNNSEGADEFVKPLYPGHRMLDRPKAKELTMCAHGVRVLYASYKKRLHRAM